MRVLFVALVLVVATSAPAASSALELCRGGDRAARKVTCVVDGDTVWIKGLKMRLLDIDAPEMHGQCEAETRRATEATDRLAALMASGYSVEDSGRKDRTSDHRALVRIRLADGRDAGSALVEEGLAQPWPNRGNVWCDSE